MSFSAPYIGKFAALSDDFVHVHTKKRPRHHSSTPPPVTNKEFIEKHYNPAQPKNNFKL